MQASLGAPGDLEHVRRLACLPSLQLDADARPREVVPGRFDEQTACVTGAGLRDRAAGERLARLLQRRDEPEPRRKLAAASETTEVADLEREHQRGQGADAAEAARARDGWRHGCSQASRDRGSSRTALRCSSPSIAAR